MAEASIATVLLRLGELGARQVALRQEVVVKIMLLRDKLEWLQTFIRDVDRQRRLRGNEMMRLWVRQTCDVVYDVEDAVEQFAPRPAAARRRAQGLCGWLVLWEEVRGLCRQFQQVHILLEKVRKIEKRLEAMHKNREEYKLEHLPSATPTSSSTVQYIDPSRIHTADEEQFIVGFDDKMKTLESYLTDQTTLQLAMVVVSGDSGAGKRKLVFNTRENVRSYFDFHIWYSLLPTTASTDALLRDFYNNLRENEHGTVAEATAACPRTMVPKLLAKYKYLVVVVGTFTIRTYESFRSVLPNNQNGSRLVFIPSPGSIDVGGYATIYTPLKLEGLGQNDTLKLFRYHAFGRDEEGPKEFRNYESKIFDITKGLPLNTVLLAGLLRSKEMPAGWNTTLHDLLPEAEEQQQLVGTGVLLDRLLSQIFEDLPHNLKSCFLYLAAFGNGAHIEIGHLIRLWTAEGFIRPQKGKTIEEVAYSYLINLISRYMLRVEEKDELYSVKTVSIHTRLLEFAQSEAAEAGFLHAHNLSDKLCASTTRRLALQNWDNCFVPLIDSFPKLRSVVCSFVEEPTEHEKQQLDFLFSSKFLRVLDLEGLTLNTLPKEICTLIHMRYLRLKLPHLNQLPSSIANLSNLQTLDVRETKVNDITNKFWCIVTLRHVLANNMWLPSQVAAHHVTPLSNLQTLSGFVAPKAWPQEGLSLLENAPAIQVLKLKKFKAADRNALDRALQKLERLIYLHLEGESLPVSVFTHQTLCQLRRVELHGKLEGAAALSFANTHHLRPSLAVLVLERTLLQQEFIHAVAKMASLIVLELGEESFCSKEMLFPKCALPRLKKLRVFDLPELDQLTVDDSALLSLEEFKTKGCNINLKVPERLSSKQPEMVASVVAESINCSQEPSST